MASSKLPSASSISPVNANSANLRTVETGFAPTLYWSTFSRESMRLMLSSSIWALTRSPVAT